MLGYLRCRHEFERERRSGQRILKRREWFRGLLRLGARARQPPAGRRQRGAHPLRPRQHPEHHRHASHNHPPPARLRRRRCHPAKARTRSSSKPHRPQFHGEASHPRPSAPEPGTLSSLAASSPMPVRCSSFLQRALMLERGQVNPTLRIRPKRNPKPPRRSRAAASGAVSRGARAACPCQESAAPRQRPEHAGRLDENSHQQRPPHPIRLKNQSFTHLLRDHTLRRQCGKVPIQQRCQ